MSNRFGLTFLCLFFSWAGLSAQFNFLVVSDLHSDGEEFKNSPERITNMCNFIDAPGSQIQSVLITGDVTDTGAGKPANCWSCCWSDSPDEWKYFNDACLQEFKKRKVSVYVCPGNHDTYSGKCILESPALSSIKQLNGGTAYYSFDQGDIHFVSCGIYPDANIRKWLAKDLVLATQKDKARPIVLFFHYNLEGPYGDWWSTEKDQAKKDVDNQNQKQAFLEIIQSYNIQAIFVGHWHNSYINLWNGFRVVGTGGEKFASCSYDPQEKTLDVTLV